MGDWAGTTGESEANGARKSYRAVEDERVLPPRHEGSRRREDVLLRLPMTGRNFGPMGKRRKCLIETLRSVVRQDDGRVHVRLSEPKSLNG